MSIIETADAVKARDIDKDVKNKFRSDWLDKKVTLCLKSGNISVALSDCICKVNLPGKAKCLLCTDIIDYGGRGYSTLVRHMNSAKHLKAVELRRSNFELNTTFSGISSQPSTSSETQPAIPISARVLTAQATVLGFLAENSLPFTLAPRLIELSKELSRDNKALSALSMDRTSASMKMQYGLGKTLLDETVNNLKSSFFSFNIDEATSNNSMRVLTILVSYYSENLKQVIIEHLSSVSLLSVNSQNIFDAIDSIMREKDIPYQNLMSILMDSCAVMRGSKTGLETRIRQNKAPHLLDVDGDSCHHVHNATKKFCRKFDYFIEGFFTDLHNDFRWSAELKQHLNQICQYFGIRFAAPQRYLSHRWLSCYEVSVETLRMWDALTIFYYAYLNVDDSVTYLSVVLAIFQKLGTETTEDVKKIQGTLKKIQPSTNDGKQRRFRIIEKMFYYRKKTLLILQVYTAVLPLLKKYVMLFQTNEPSIHMLYDEQKRMFKTFLSCFIKPEIVKDLSGEDLAAKKFIVEKNVLKNKELFVGANALRTISKCNNTIVIEFYQQLKSAYIDCALYLQKKLPLDNSFLINASALNPLSRGKTTTLKRLEELPLLAKNVLNDDEIASYMLEIREYQFHYLPPSFSSNNEPLTLNEWWSKIFSMGEFPALSKLVKALISCFHGPAVEGSFSTMNHIIDPRSGRLDIKTYSAVQTVKYSLRSKKKSAVKYFHRENFLRDIVDSNLIKNMSSSSKRYREEKAETPKKKRKIETKKDGQILIKNAESFALKKFQKQKKNKMKKDQLKRKMQAKEIMKNNRKNNSEIARISAEEPSQTKEVMKNNTKNNSEITIISAEESSVSAKTKNVNQKELWKNFFNAAASKKK